jgi:hypothetical protein
MCLAKVNDLPIVLARHWIGIALAQKADIVRILQLIDRRRVAPELAVVELDRSLVLLAAVDQLQFFVALDRFRDPGRGDGQGKQDQRHQEQHGKQNVSCFGVRAALW